MTGIAVYTGIFSTGFASIEAERPATLLMDGRMLARSKERLEAGDAELKPALSALLRSAEQALHAGPFSVVNNPRTAPSGDKHDYVSFSRYWWPDPAQPDGLPYIRRDGETNPETQGAASDRVRLESMTDAVEILALAYYFTDDLRFAEHAAELIRVWFLNPETLMNPNLNFAQGVPGRSDGKKSGLIDGRLFCQAIDGILLISDAEVLSEGEQKTLRAWFARYLDWLKTNELARAESESENNHGTFFDVQMMCVALFAGDHNHAKRVARRAEQRRIKAQIEEDGSQPEELARTRSLFYSIFNLEAMFQMARLAEHTGVDLWDAADERIHEALDYVVPYADPAKPWPHPEVVETERSRMLQLLVYAADVFDDVSYQKQIEMLPAETGTQLEHLAVPLMR